MVYQTAEVVRLAHEVLLGGEWARLVDWEGYRAEYRSDRFEVLGEVVVEPLDKLRDVWAAMGFSQEKVESLAALLREGNYALRTEENYLQWVVRLMAHISGRISGRVLHFNIFIRSWSLDRCLHFSSGKISESDDKPPGWN